MVPVASLIQLICHRFTESLYKHTRKHTEHTQCTQAGWHAYNHAPHDLVHTTTSTNAINVSFTANVDVCTEIDMVLSKTQRVIGHIHRHIQLQSVSSYWSLGVEWFGMFDISCVSLISIVSFVQFHVSCSLLTTLADFIVFILIRLFWEHRARHTQKNIKIEDVKKSSITLGSVVGIFDDTTHWQRKCYASVVRSLIHISNTLKECSVACCCTHMSTEYDDHFKCSIWCIDADLSVFVAWHWSHSQLSSLCYPICWERDFEFCWMNFFFYLNKRIVFFLCVNWNDVKPSTTTLLPEIILKIVLFFDVLLETCKQFLSIKMRSSSR